MDNYYIRPDPDGRALEIWGYTSQLSYRPGDRVDLRVSTTGTHWGYEVGRDGATCDPMLRQDGLTGVRQDTPEECSVKGCGWAVSAGFDIPMDWQPGAYLITLWADLDDERVEEHHIFFLRRAIGSEPSRYLLLCATPTWLAYNCWGGSSAYEGVTGPDGRQFSPILSMDRPWSRGFCKLPEGAPRALPDQSTVPGDMARYPYMEWAYSYGYSKKYASAGWASYERHFVRWAEAEGYDLEIATLHDLEADPDLLDGHACVIFVGHDEYWSANMRHHLDTWVDAGGRVARFAGNFLWQVRIGDAGRLMECHKYMATLTDPVMGTDDQSLLTGAWEQPEVGWPGAETFGVNGLRGVYAGLGKCAGGGPGGFTVYQPGHWAFADAHLGFGDVLGAQSRVFGYEVDGLDYEIRNGVPVPLGTDGGTDDMHILAMGLASNIEDNHGVWGETLYIGSADAEWAAQALFGEVTEQTLDRARRGSGMIVHWPKGRGEVFTAATCEWVMGLSRRDRQIEQVTHNVLQRFGGQPS
ncbi:MAG: N,N-dimethylformamidase beta subunit family domain-containing protein [Paracoccaceae bacterium]